MFSMNVILSFEQWLFLFLDVESVGMEGELYYISK